LGKVNVTITEEALQLLSHFSGGFPVLMHELGDAVFKVDKDNSIDTADTLAGIMSSAQVIGAKYIEPNVLATIRSDKYQHILKKSRNDRSSIASAEKTSFLNSLRRRQKFLTISCEKWKPWEQFGKTRNGAREAMNLPVSFITSSSGCKHRRINE
jgi:hypothetical protein